MTNKQKLILIRIIASAAGMVTLLLVAALGELNLLWFLLPYFIAGYDVLWGAVTKLIRGSILDERFLMSIATVGALILGEYPEAVAVMLFYQLGELLIDLSVERSHRSIESLMNIDSDSALVIRDGTVIRCEPAEVRVGEIILVRAGDRVALDGVVVEGVSTLDTSALTGESVPREVGVGQRVLSGSVNIDGTLRVRVDAEYTDSTVMKINRLVTEASERKAKVETFISRFATVYTPIVVIAALKLAVIPSMVTGDWVVWTHRALLFLVVSCPCALVISVPLSFFGGIGGASRRGILIKSSGLMERLADTEIAVFDKTGTLTCGRFEVTEVSAKKDRNELLRLAATAEQGSAHPVARSICALWDKPLTAPKKVETLVGKGVVADGIACGSYALMEELSVKCDRVESSGNVVYVARDKKYIGHIIVDDRIRDTSAAAVEQLHAQGIYTVMLTGDGAQRAREVADSLKIDEVHAELLPDSKVERLEEIEKSTPATVCYVGDGINDAPVLAGAQVGIAMGGIGSDAAIEAADVVIMDDDPAKVAEAVRISKRSVAVARQNVWISLGVKLLVLVLGAFGMVGMWAAVFADVGVSLIAVLNAMRCMKPVKSDEPQQSEEERIEE